MFLINYKHTMKNLLIALFLLAGFSAFSQTKADSTNVVYNLITTDSIEEIRTEFYGKKKVVSITPVEDKETFLNVKKASFSQRLAPLANDIVSVLVKHEELVMDQIKEINVAEKQYDVVLSDTTNLTTFLNCEFKFKGDDKAHRFKMKEMAKGNFLQFTVGETKYKVKYNNYILVIYGYNEEPFTILVPVKQEEKRLVWRSLNGVTLIQFFK